MHRLEVYESNVVTVEPQYSCVDVADEMDARSVGCVVVVDGDKPLGIITDRDLICRLVAADRDPEKTTAAEVMTADPITATRDDDMTDVLARMRERGIRRIPLVEENQLVGLVSLDEVIIKVASYLFNTSQGLLGGLHQSRRTAPHRRRLEAREAAFDELRDQLQHMGSEVREHLDQLLSRVRRGK
ncbi:MAG: CBS domain-containing protein [Deltaproteobacteria bacterium]|nr:CBS domain-containing protein [Deltaproteobacteria bacterium]MBW2696089.1 CBS domain-containing protein [Deltaproteobacteria bacterium]